MLVVDSKFDPVSRSLSTCFIGGPIIVCLVICPMLMMSWSCPSYSSDIFSTFAGPYKHSSGCCQVFPQFWLLPTVMSIEVNTNVSLLGESIQCYDLTEAEAKGSDKDQKILRSSDELSKRLTLWID